LSVCLTFGPDNPPDVQIPHQKHAVVTGLEGHIHSGLIQFNRVVPRDSIVFGMLLDASLIVGPVGGIREAAFAPAGLAGPLAWLGAVVTGAYDPVVRADENSPYGLADAVTAGGRGISEAKEVAIPAWPVPRPSRRIVLTVRRCHVTPYSRVDRK